MLRPTVHRVVPAALAACLILSPAARADSGGTTATAASSTVGSATVAPSQTRTVRLTRRQLRSVQRRVGVRADGVLGPGTRSALRRYQTRKRLKRTGRPNLETLRAMRLAFATAVEERLRAAAAPAAPVAGYTFPIRGAWRFGGARTGFGERGGAHQGVDLLAGCGVPVAAASAGRVKTNAHQSAAGNYLVVTDTPSGEDQVYMHLREKPDLRPGDPVAPGQALATVGDTGNATDCLLHFELWSAPGWYEGGKPRDPQQDLASWSGAAAR